MKSAESVWVATATCAALIAFQMAGKATRDAVFLSTFDVAALPSMVIVSSLVALGLALGAARALPRFTPARLLPAVLGASAVLLLVEWVLLGPLRRPTAILVYLHYGGLGALLISGFWSLVTERFDPRSAKRLVGRIAAGGTVGGLLGGVLAERVAVWLSMPAMLPILAGLHAACALLVMRLRPAAPGIALPAPAASGLRTIGETPYLRGLVAVVVLVSLSEGLIDFVFKARAAAAFGRGEELLRLFAVFYTVVGVFTAVVQATASRAALQRLGLAPTVALMPGVVALGGVAALGVPGLASAAALRGTEAVLRNSLYRAGYELLFTPLPTAERRATKTLIDIGALRVGDVAGGGLVQLVLIAAAGHAQPVLLVSGAVFAAAAAVAALSLQKGYIAALERNLVAQAVHLEPDEVSDLTTRTLLQSVVSLGLTRRPPGSAVVAAHSPTPTAPAAALDPVADRVARLRSADPAVLRAALTEEPLTPPLAGHVVALLARDDVMRDVVAALRPLAERLTGQLVDRLLDPDEDFAVRRRLPLVLAAAPTERAADGLLLGLADRRFEVRYRCGRALARSRDAKPDLRIASERVLAAVLAEVAVDRSLWESRRLLDAAEDDAAPSTLVDQVLRERANRSLEHVFTLLGLVLPQQPLTIAFRGLHTDDPMLRGTALEYLETALPPAVREGLWQFLEAPAHPPAPPRPAGQIVADLLRSRESIALNLEELRRRSGA